MDNTAELLALARRLALQTLKSLPTRPVHATADVHQLRSTIRVPLTESGLAPEMVLEQLYEAADPGIIASAGPRYFGFVIGGTYPIAIAADWLTTIWDQNSGIYSTSPATSVIEETTAGYVLDLLGLPSTAGVGFVTGGQMANFTCLAAARHSVLRSVGWNVEERGLSGAPRVNILLPAEAHVTIHSSLRLLGFGTDSITYVPCDDQGRMIPDELAKTLAGCSGPIIVTTQAGNVNSGSFDPLAQLIPLAHERGAWVHVDGAFGLWAAATETRRALVEGFRQADSWATDAHKWMNVPYDCGIAIVSDAAAHRAAMTLSAAYLEQTAGVERDSVDWVPDFSRRARAIPLYTVLRFLGRAGVAALIERCCAHATQFAAALETEEGVQTLNDVVLNQVLVRFSAEGRESDTLTREVIRRVQQDGICWLSGTTWQGQAAMRISVSNWSTSEADVRMSAEAILSAFHVVRNSSS